MSEADLANFGQFITIATKHSAEIEIFKTPRPTGPTSGAVRSLEHFDVWSSALAGGCGMHRCNCSPGYWISAGYKDTIALARFKTNGKSFLEMLYLYRQYKDVDWRGEKK